jgi:hypothetical protein
MPRRRHYLLFTAALASLVLGRERRTTEVIESSRRVNAPLLQSIASLFESTWALTWVHLA